MPKFKKLFSGLKIGGKERDGEALPSVKRLGAKLQKRNKCSFDIHANGSNPSDGAQDHERPAAASTLHSRSDLYHGIGLAVSSLHPMPSPNIPEPYALAQPLMGADHSSGSSLTIDHAVAKSTGQRHGPLTLDPPHRRYQAGSASSIKSKKLSWRESSLDLVYGGLGSSSEATTKATKTSRSSYMMAAASNSAGNLHERFNKLRTCRRRKSLDRDDGPSLDGFEFDWGEQADARILASASNLFLQQSNDHVKRYAPVLQHLSLASGIGKGKGREIVDQTDVLDVENEIDSILKRYPSAAHLRHSESSGQAEARSAQNPEHSREELIIIKQWEQDLQHAQDAKQVRAKDVADNHPERIGLHEHPDWQAITAEREHFQEEGRSIELEIRRLEWEAQDRAYAERIERLEIEAQDLIRARELGEQLQIEQKAQEAQDRIEAERLWEEMEAEARAAAQRARSRECTCCSDSKDPFAFPAKPPTSLCEHASQTCQECLDGWLSSEFDTKGCDDISCPDCSQSLEYGDIQRGASAETFAAYDKLATRNALGEDEEFSWCLAPTCGSGQMNMGNNHFMDCANCSYKQCLKHKVPWHTGETCDQYEYRNSGRKTRDEERKTAAMIDTVSKRCPGTTCGWRIQKTEGCEHMTCKKCKHEFCWICLASHKEIRRVGNTAHSVTCKFHSHNLSVAWPFNAH